MTSTRAPQADVVERTAAPTLDRARGLWSLIGVLAVVVAFAVGFGAGWLIFDDDDGRNEGERPDGPAVSVPVGVEEVVDRFLLAYETNDYALLQEVVTENFRRPFYEGDAGGAAWRDVYRIEAYSFMDDPNLSDLDLVFYDVERVGERAVRGTGPWIVSEAQNWRQSGQPTQFESFQTIVVVEVDGTFLVDDAYWAGSTALVAAE